MWMALHYKGKKKQMAKVDLIVTGGTIVNSDGRFVADIVVSDGVVQQLIKPGSGQFLAADKAIDATGLLVLPGGVDPHCHVDTKLGEFATVDDYRSASIAAIWGGTTTIVDFAFPSDGQGPLAAVRQRSVEAAEARCSVALHACVRQWEDSVPDQLRQLAAEGVTTVKLFTTYRDLMMLNADEILAVMKVMRDSGGLTYVHAESNHIIEDAQAAGAAAGHIASVDHPHTRPEIAEKAAVEEVLSIAEAIKAPVYFVHQTTPEVVDMVTAARNRGVRAYSETCTHYVTLDSSHYQGAHPELYVCCPPLRSPSTVAALRTRVVGGAVATIGSDNCCFPSSAKKISGHDVRSMPYGLPGVEQRMPVLFSEFVHGEGMSVEQFVELTAHRPAELNGLADRKGSIVVGADADLVIWDPHLVRTITVEGTHQGVDYDPYEGRVVRGWPRDVVVAGRIALRNRMFTDPGPVNDRIFARSIF